MVNRKACRILQSNLGYIKPIHVTLVTSIIIESVPIASKLNDNTKSTNNFTLVFIIKQYSSFRFPYVPLPYETKEQNFPTSTSSSITSPSITPLDLLAFAPPTIVNPCFLVSSFFHRHSVTLVVLDSPQFHLYQQLAFCQFFRRSPMSTKGFVSIQQLAPGNESQQWNRSFRGIKTTFFCSDIENLKRRKRTS